MTEPKTFFDISDTQKRAFAKLTMEQRFNWHMDLLALCYELTPPETRRRWRENKAKV